MSYHVLYETASGYALFERLQSEEIGRELDQVQAAAQDLSKFGRFIKLVSFIPFKTAAHALENLNDVSEGVMNPYLKAFLEQSMPKVGKKSSVKLGVGEKNLAGAIKAELGYDCISDDSILEIIRGLKLHGEKMLKQLSDGDLNKAQLGLGHAYSRAKVKFNVNRVDNMIIQSIALLDQLDKDVNTFSMRVREWYSWHFPELVKLVNDNALYAKCVKIVKNKANLTEDHIPELEEVGVDPAIAKHVIDAAKSSMGTDISDIDMLNIQSFADRVIALAEYRKRLHAYLVSKMHAVAPNLSALLGEMVGARLVSHAGSLTNLAKYPASTVQILGAEKALFRALKTKGNTPKYGLIYHSTFIGRAATKNKGRISRFLANKASIASRIDCFLETPTSLFGEKLREQVEERLKFYEDGTAPKKNTEMMEEALSELRTTKGDDMDVDDEPIQSPAKKKKVAETADEGEKKKKSKKSKKAASVVEEPVAEETAMEVDGPVVEKVDKKKKKSKKAKSAE
ncbi:hypothetical protein SmJEL517_g03307 [Synchytrium microbalum]|uniref:Nucleolar protein 56 n=1 Tax=Synchytrium microbalum TaxID=1806994 RepID=A0A507C385_9FUNG|nr:uncharacterized protein SmJEL517_g03307 [Synchytrium microbalum]TPX33838.1 hypothetical protein SmJEL517_g03307 [Synchytrium microbalum]